MPSLIGVNLTPLFTSNLGLIFNHVISKHGPSETMKG